MEKVYNVLFLSRRNSARSLMAELVLNRHGRGKFCAFSAGVEPSPNVDPIALDVLRQAGYATDGLQPKHWRKLGGRDGPIVDFVFTLSDTAAGETLPEWRGQPATATDQGRRRRVGEKASIWSGPCGTRAPAANIRAASFRLARAHGSQDATGRTGIGPR
jgi:protein-tyrosine-phosphatase